MKLCFLNYRFVYMYMCIFGYTHKFTDDKLKAYIFAKRVLL